MDVQTIKLGLVQKLLNVNSRTVLKKIDQILDKEIIVAYTVTGDPLTKEAYNKRLAKAEKQFKSGDYITQEELEQETKNW